MTLAPRIGLFGAFDTGDYGDLVLPLIFERELLRRLPAASLTFYSPNGWGHTAASKGGIVCEPFAAVDGALDLTIAAGTYLPARPFVTANVWSAVAIPAALDPAVKQWLRSDVHLSVAEETSKQRLEAIGVETPIEILPDPRLLVRDLSPADVLERRIRQLRAIGAYPKEEHPVIEHLDPDVTIEDAVAALAHARAYAGPSSALATMASAFHGAGQEAAFAQLSAHFDRIADLAERHAAHRANADLTDLQRREIASLAARNETLRNALQAVRERAAAERVLFAQAVNRFQEGDLDASTLVREHGHFVAESSRAKHAEAVAAQRAAAAEERSGELGKERDALVERLAAEDAEHRRQLQELGDAERQLREQLAKRDAELRHAIEEHQRLGAELWQVRGDLGNAAAENERHRLVLGTRLVRWALRLQRLLSGRRGK